MLEDILILILIDFNRLYGDKTWVKEVLFTEELRAQTCMAAERLHRLLAGGLTPSAQYEKKCDHCSLIEICLPKKVADQACRVENYLRERLA